LPCSSRKSAQALRRWHVVTGQVVGFTGLVAISLLGFAFSFLLPRPYIGLLGILPILLGLRSWSTPDEDEPQVEVRAGDGFAGVLSVAVVTFANGADNIGIYTPLFASSTLPELLVTLTIFYLMLFLWCLAGYFIARQPAIAKLLGRYGHIVMPLVLIGLGVFILLESGTLSLVGLG
jgi:cadmium resistance protein CadD (predicted permease)